MVLTGCGAFAETCSRERLMHLRISVDGLEQEFKIPALAAVKSWNSSVGHDYFVMSDFLNQPDLWIRTTNTHKDHYFGFFVSRMIFIQDNLEGQLVMVVLMHELGHSMGLGHSQDPNSVMYRTSWPEKNFQPTPEDIENAIAAISAMSSTVCN